MLLILDFDGVICNSTKECYFVSRLVSLDKKIHIKRNDQTSKKYFYKHRNLVKTAGEFFIILNKKINRNKNLSTKDINNLYKKNRDLINIFEKKFYQQRNKLIKTNLKKWLSLNYTYKKLLKLVNNINDSKIHHVNIVSLKDQKSIREILKSNHIEKIPILGKERVKTKKESIRFLQNKFNYLNDQIIFIDDNIDHLNKVKDLKIKTFLPAWNKELQDIKKSNLKFISLQELRKIFL